MLFRSLISEEEAVKNATNPNELSLKLKGIDSASDRTWQPVDAAAETAPAGAPPDGPSLASARGRPDWAQG